MAIKYQFNKTSLNELGKQLKVRTKALPTIKSKESALRLEVKKARDMSEQYSAQIEVYPLITTNARNCCVVGCLRLKRALKPFG